MIDKAMPRLPINFCFALTLLAALVSAHGSSTNNIAASAGVSTSHVSALENLLAIKDGLDPTSSTDKTGVAYGNWPTTGTNWVEYQWSELDWPVGVT